MRWQLSGGLILTPLLFAGLSACSTLGAVSNEDAAIAIFKKICPHSARSDFGPNNKWDAQLEGDYWHVHAQSQMTYVGIVPRWVDTYLDVLKDGSPPPGHCLERATE